ncbi:MAG: DNA repair protein RadA [Actinobacteria bacterium]|nr:DNA repair protein RadA [Actinomycetota bacterium]
MPGPATKQTTSRANTLFVCTECGTAEAKWHGQCPGCGEWNTLVEERPPQPLPGIRARKSGAARGGTRAAALAEPIVLSEIRAERVDRISTGIGEFDRVLGGGIVPGSLVLLGGSPGIGKSTLTGHALGNLIAAGETVLYVSGEESPEQIRMRHERLGDAALGVPVLAETDLQTVLETIDRHRPRVVVIDSIQTLHCADLSGAPGSVGQVREAAARLMQLAKTREIAMLLVGHVTKEGALAGPRVLEHLVDCVLQFEGERERSYRTLRGMKNRFGSTNEVGVFEMERGGLVEILDASARFVGEATGNPGSVVMCAMEGTRPLLVEIQALVSPTEVVPPRRVANGIDRNRLALVLAVLGRHGGIGLGAHDVFVNVAGGVRVEEPAADLAVALAIASAARGRALSHRDVPLACFGEIGLTGELREVPHADRRLEEASKFGLRRVVAPATASSAADVPFVRAAAGAEKTARNLRQALSAAFDADESADDVAANVVAITESFDT